VAKKLSKKMKAMSDARISKAIGGFVIPMMEIPKLYSKLELGVEFGFSDEELKNIVAGWSGVKESV